MDGFNQFALTLYNDIRNDTECENVFFSPFSVYTALAMVYAGSRGKTADEIKATLKTLHQATEDHIFNEINKIWSDVSSTNIGVTLDLANNFWVQDNFHITNDYKMCLEKFFETTPTSADFINNYEKVRKEINEWVESKTNDKIKDLIPSGALNPLTRLVLVNAIYFYGEWLNAFSERSTTKRDFFNNGSEKSKVDMMFQNSKFKYIQDKQLDSQLISLPYKQSSLSFVIVLPKKKTGLSAVEGKVMTNLKDKKLNDVFSKLHSSRAVKVKVFLPKFKFEHSVNLKQHLISIGIKDLFSMEDADLSGIAESNELFVSDAFHKAFVEVDEKGTEADAATAVIMKTRGCAVNREEIIFNAEHPFLFFIHDKKTNIILFMGKVVQM